MSRRQLMREMDANEVLRWMAYEMSIDADNHKKYTIEIQEEEAKTMTDEQRAQIIKNMINLASGTR